MKNPKKHINALFLLAMVLLSPLLLLATIFYIPYGLHQNRKAKKQYLASPYYQKFGLRFRPWLPDQPGCRFYNDAVAAGYDPLLVHQASNGADYLLLENSVYVFQLQTEDVQAIYYSDEHGEWRVLADGDCGSLTEEWKKTVEGIETAYSGKTPRLLLERWMIWPRDSGDSGYEETDAGEEDLALELLPPFVTLVEQYLDILGGTE